MRENDNTMNSMKPNGAPHIDDEDKHPIKLFKSVSPSPVQPGDSGDWKDEDYSGKTNENVPEAGPYFLNSGHPRKLNAIGNHLHTQQHNGNHKKEPAEPLSSSHSKRYKATDTNGNSHLFSNTNGIDTFLQLSTSTTTATQSPLSLPTDSVLTESSDEMEVADSDQVTQQIEKMEVERDHALNTNLNSPCDNQNDSDLSMETDEPIPEDLYAVVDIAPDISEHHHVAESTTEVITENTTDIAVSSNAEESVDTNFGCTSPERSTTPSLEHVTRQDVVQLTNQHRAAQLICRLIQIRARLMSSPRCRVEAKKQKIRAHRDRRHIPLVTQEERKLIELPSGENDSKQSLRLVGGSDSETVETDESDIEEVGFLNDKIGYEQRKIRLREKIEEEKSRKIESRRTWLLRQIQTCKNKRKAIVKRLENESQYVDSTQNAKYNDDEDELADVGCARSRLYSRKPRRSALKRVQKRLDLPKTAFEQFSRISQLDNTYHHVLSTPRSIPLSTRLTAVLHDLDPASSVELKKSHLKGRNERREKRFSTEKKKQKQRNAEALINHIVVPTSSLITAIEMPKYKNIQTPGYRSDHDSDCQKEDLDEDISHESYVRRHIIAEKQEKMRYYQSAIQNSRRKKKQQINPRLASPKPESYLVNSDEESYGYKKIKYPIPPSQVGENGYKELPKKKKKQWRSSTTDGNGLRLKLSLRKT